MTLAGRDNGINRGIEPKLACIPLSAETSAKVAAAYKEYVNTIDSGNFFDIQQGFSVFNHGNHGSASIHYLGNLVLLQRPISQLRE
jgi:hypothetical protein